VTVRDSSLSACCQAVLAAEVGHLDLAYDYIVESALADLRDREQDSADGLHLAALAGTWIALVAGFGGMRQVDGELRFRPALPPVLTRLTFRVRHRGARLCVTVGGGEARYALEEGESLTIRHEGEELEVKGVEPVVRPLTPRPAPKAPEQPRHRGPIRRDAPPAP
jgi:alpha,alpha-trehalose phosphorylase